MPRLRPPYPCAAVAGVMALCSAHPDGLMALLLRGAAAAWRRGRAWQMGLWLGAACATKVSARVVLPLLLVAPHLSPTLSISQSLLALGRRKPLSPLDFNAMVKCSAIILCNN